MYLRKQQQERECREIRKKTYILLGVSARDQADELAAARCRLTPREPRLSIACRRVEIEDHGRSAASMCTYARVEEEEAAAAAAVRTASLHNSTATYARTRISGDSGCGFCMGFCVESGDPETTSTSAAAC